MTCVYRKTVFLEEHSTAARSDLYRDVVSGLSCLSKELPPKYFYDDTGSDIYREITDTTEYYLTNAEESILAKHAADMVAAHVAPLRGSVNICELGAGDGRKTKIFLNALLRADVSFEYIPIDISDGAMENLFKSFEADFGGSIRVHGLVANYHEGLQHVVRLHPERSNVVLFLGSSLGNFPPAMGRSFLRSVAGSLRGGDRLLLGCDLKKNPRVLQRAYDDGGGVTKRFNLNLLERLNRELGADFKVDRFYHHALYDAQEGCMKSFLLSKEAQTVRIPPQGSKGNEVSVVFDEWEPILTEHSYKYTAKEVRSMLKETGFDSDSFYTDDDHLFLDTFATVRHT